MSNGLSESGTEGGILRIGVCNVACDTLSLSLSLVVIHQSMLVIYDAPAVYFVVHAASFSQAVWEELPDDVQYGRRRMEQKQSKGVTCWCRQRRMYLLALCLSVCLSV
jgi:hypothetical protein